MEGSLTSGLSKEYGVFLLAGGIRTNFLMYSRMFSSRTTSPDKLNGQLVWAFEETNDVHFEEKLLTTDETMPIQALKSPE